MIYWILKFFSDLTGYKVPMAFSYTSTRMMLAAITALMISIFMGPQFIKKLYELKVGQPIRTEDCPLLGGHQLHEKKKDTPTMGGLLILFSMVIALLLWMDLTHVFTLILLATTVVFGFLGGRDDYLKLKYKNTKGLSGKKKMVIQLGLGGLIALYLLSPSVTDFIHFGKWFSPPVVKEQIAVKVSDGDKTDTVLVGKNLSMKEYATRWYIPFFKEPFVAAGGLITLLTGLWIAIVITGASNAVNLTDGLDGLAAGCLLMVAFCLGLIAFVSNNSDLAAYLNILYIEGSGEIAVYLSAFSGACLGFLWYNSHPAQVFMGDTGSLTLGGIIGVSAILLRREFLLALVGGIFVAEALSVIIQVASYKLRDKKRVFLCAPLHHHFEYKGWPETKVVTRFWIIAFLLAVLGLVSLKLQ